MVVCDYRAVANQELSDHEGGNRAHSSLDGEEARRQSIPPQVFPDNQQVFVGNLPQYLSDKELHEFFGRTLPSVVCEFLIQLTWVRHGRGSSRQSPKLRRWSWPVVNAFDL